MPGRGAASSARKEDASADGDEPRGHFWQAPLEAAINKPEPIHGTMPRKRKSNKDPIVEIVQLDGQDYAVATANDASMIAVEWINDDAHVSAHLHVNTNETRLKKTYNITSNQQYTTIHSHLQTFPLVQRDCHRAKTLHQGHCLEEGKWRGDFHDAQ